MPAETVSRKSDVTSKVPTQTIAPKTWTLLEVEGEKVIIPKGNSAGLAAWAIYLNIDAPKQLVGTGDLFIRWVRNPKQVYAKPIVGDLHDFTGERGPIALRSGRTYISEVWNFFALKRQPVGVELFHTCAKAITINTRETKMSYEVSK